MARRDYYRPIGFSLIESQNVLHGRKLKFIKKLACVLTKGAIVKHNGNSSNSSRVGWVGVIVGTQDDENALDIIWLLDKNGSPLKQDSCYTHEAGIYQRYTLGWAKDNIISGKLCNYNVRELLLNKEELEMSQKKEGLFLVWGPKGHSNPKNPTNYESALHAAKAMTKKHKEEFYVVRLDTHVEPVIDTKVETL